MSGNYSIYAGTIGLSLWGSTDGGDTWKGFVNGPFGKDAPYEAQFRGLAIDPQNSAVVYGGDEKGVYRTTDRGASWEQLHGPFDGTCVWSLAVDPNNSNILFAGTRPPALYRSKDAGKHWEKLSAKLPQVCSIGVPRMTAIRVDPADSRKIWASQEIGGTYRSLDGGDTWVRILGGLTESDADSDTHNLNLVPNSEIRSKDGRSYIAPGKKTTVLVTLVGALYATDDDGESMRLIASRMQMPMRYMRGTAVQPGNPSMIFMGVGDTVMGKEGAILRSVDGGLTWEICHLPSKPNSAIFHLATHPSQPDLVVAASIMGHLFQSPDAGKTWKKIDQELSEVRALAWAAN